MIDPDTLGLLMQGLTHVTPQSLVMIGVACVLLYLGIVKDYEPLLLLPIGAGCLLANLPLSPLIAEDGMLRVLYDMGIGNELFPLLIFIGIGALTDFGPLLENPRLVLLGAAGQFGIFLTLLLALLLGFTRPEAASIGIIGAIDGPTSIYVSGLLAPHLLGPITVAAYSYMCAGADHPAADHEAADDAEGAAHPHALQPARRSAGARASCSRSSSPCWWARWCPLPRR